MKTTFLNQEENNATKQKGHLNRQPFVCNNLFGLILLFGDLVIGNHTIVFNLYNV
jgi:hypothetical protein